MADEDPVSVTDNGTRHAMNPKDIFGENLRNLGCRVWMSYGEEVAILRQAVDHNQNRSLAVGGWKTVDEVHSDIHPDVLGNQQ